MKELAKMLVDANINSGSVEYVAKLWFYSRLIEQFVVVVFLSLLAYGIYRLIKSGILTR